MKVSYNWLQSYFEEQLPKQEKLAEVLTMHSFEVESVEEVNGDKILDIDILPNRSSDSLSHRGIAKEISSVLNIKIKSNDTQIIETPHPDNVISIDVEEPTLCRRYVGKVIENVKVGPSPLWLKERLEAIGQKSINNIVDATNFVMFDMGQPLHAFDIDKLGGKEIIVRNARIGEKIITLDDKEVELSEKDLVIADRNDVLAIAGIKGGKKAEVNEDTTNILFEAANFEPVNIRRTSHRLGISTDSSKRFENDITPELAGYAIEEAALLIHKILNNIVDETESNMKIGESVQFYPRRAGEYKVGVSAYEVNNLLGTSLSDKDTEDILNRIGFKFEKIENPIEKVLELAQKFVGVPYKFGASITYDAPRYFDCSSFTSYLFAQAGVAIPRISIDQFVFGEEIKEKDLKAGDLVFSNTHDGEIHYESVEFMKGTKIKEGVDHCGVYVGEGEIVHSSRYNGDGVEVQDLSNSEQFKDIIGYRRIVNGKKLRYVITVPPERLDLRIKEDLIEEIGKVYGYENIDAKLPEILDYEKTVNKELHYINKTRKFLVSKGFSEVYNYSLVPNGKVELQNPPASDKKFLRTNLSDGIKENLNKNSKNMPLLGIEDIKIFEFGNVFDEEKEYKSLSLGYYKNIKKSVEIAKEFLEKIKAEIENKLEIKFNIDIEEGVFEVNFDELVKKLPEPKTEYLETEFPDGNVRYKSISQYPFVLRDIAVWVPDEIENSGIFKIIKDNAGDLLVRATLFDEFKKDGKVSYAFNLVFQSNDRTLTDDEIGKIMDKITDKINSKPDWQVR